MRTTIFAGGLNNKIQKGEKAMYTYKVWDKKSSINGVKTADVLKIHGITEGEVGLILTADGKVAVLQYDNANPLSKADLTAKLKDMADAMNAPANGGLDEPREDETK
jgi:hypothetical protein